MSKKTKTAKKESYFRDLPHKRVPQFVTELSDTEVKGILYNIGDIHLLIESFRSVKDTLSRELPDYKADFIDKLICEITESIGDKAEEIEELFQRILKIQHCIFYDDAEFYLGDDDEPIFIELDKHFAERNNG